MASFRGAGGSETNLFRADGLRAQKIGNSTTYYYFDDNAGDAPVYENNGAAVLNTYGATGLTSRTIGGVGTYYYLFDLQGNAIAQLAANSTPLVWSMYDAFGQRTSTESGGQGDPLDGYGGEHGYYYDTETGFSLLGHRFYYNNTGRFVNRDPAGYAGGLNLFAFAMNNPLTYPDPSGFGFSDWYWGGMGGFSNWVDDNLMGGSTKEFGCTSGLYDAGRATGWDVAWSGAKWGANLYMAANVVKDAAELGWNLGRKAYKLAFDGCFVAGTLVAVAPESASKEAEPSAGTAPITKPIEQVKAGDYVLSRDPISKRTEWKRVERTSVRTVAGVVAVHLADAAGHEVESFVCTHDHPFYVDGKGFVPAGKLAIGNAIVTRAGPDLTVSQIEFHVRPEGYEVYNLVVEADHSYFVGEGEAAAWVHNGIEDCVQLHHIYPQKWRSWFAARGIDIDQETVALDRATHLRGVHGTGGMPLPNGEAGALPGGFNARWQQWIDANPNATEDEVRAFGDTMRSDYGLTGLPTVPYH